MPCDQDRNKCCTVLSIGWKVDEVWRCGVKTLRLRRLPRAFIVWSLTEQRTQSCGSHWFPIKYQGSSAVYVWFAFLSDTAQLKKEEKESLLNNTKADVCPCMYYLFYIITVLTFLNRLYPGNVTNLSEQSCFFTRALIHTHSHLAAKKLY